MHDYNGGGIHTCQYSCEEASMSDSFQQKLSERELVENPWNQLYTFHQPKTEVELLTKAADNLAKCADGYSFYLPARHNTQIIVTYHCMHLLHHNPLLIIYQLLCCLPGHYNSISFNTMQEKAILQSSLKINKCLF